MCSSFLLVILFLFIHIRIGAHYRSHSTWDPRRHLYEELRSRRGSNETVHTHRGNKRNHSLFSIDFFILFLVIFQLFFVTSLCASLKTQRKFHNQIKGVIKLTKRKIK